MTLNAPQNPRPLPKRVVGIDFGIARIGLALSDEQKIIATPIMTFKAEKKAEATVAKLAQQLAAHAVSNRYEISEIVVGMPLLMSGKKGFLADEVLHFVELLKQHLSMPIITWDERLTTVQADRSLREGNLTRKRRAGAVDAVAAIIILQSYLDHLHLQKNT